MLVISVNGGPYGNGVYSPSARSPFGYTDIWVPVYLKGELASLPPIPILWPPYENWVLPKPGDISGFLIY